MSNQCTIVITGTSKGIGRYLAEYYAKKGFQVIGCSRRMVDYESKNYRHFCLDISDEAKVKEMFIEIGKTYKRLDALINNAGIMHMNYALLTPLQTVQKTLNTNFIGTFLCCREAVKLMQKNRHGRIINISTIAVPLSPVGSSSYSASKAAVEQFSKVLAREVASYGITVNTLALSIVKQSGMAGEIDQKAAREALAHTILKSPLDLQDIAHAADFLISSESAVITGQTLCLGGI